MASNQGSVAISHATVFDGEQWQKDQTIAFANGQIVADSTGAETVIDANGAFLLPGLIDCHVHVHDAGDLSQLAKNGVTTCLDLGTKNIAAFESFRGGVGNCDIRSSGIPAMPPGSRHTSKPGFPRRLLVIDPEDASTFVSDRVSDGADFIKIMLEAEGPNQAAVNALTTEAHVQKRKAIAHATTCDTIEKAVKAGVDVVTHVPLDQTLSETVVSDMKDIGSVAVPTLVKMLGTAETSADLDYAHSRDSAKLMKKAGVPILAGTDANKHASGPAKISYGDSIWKELELLVEVGLTPLEAIQSATLLPASYFGLGDRGAITPGKRADLVLLSKDPLADITNLSSVQRVWCGGVEV